MTAVACSNCGTVTDPPRRGMCNRCYENNRYRLNAYGQWQSGYRDAEPVRAHVNALLDAGWTKGKICRESGLAPQQLRCLLNGTRGRPPSRQVSEKTADALQSLRIAEVPAGAGDWVAVLGSRRRLRALIAAGWPESVLVERLETCRSEVRGILDGYDWVRAWRRDQITALFAELQLVRGPSESARRRGRVKKWPLPFQWDEDALDDPSRGPVYGTRREPYMPRAGAA